MDADGAVTDLLAPTPQPPFPFATTGVNCCQVVAPPPPVILFVVLDDGGSECGGGGPEDVVDIVTFEVCATAVAILCNECGTTPPAVNGGGELTGVDGFEL